MRLNTSCKNSVNELLYSHISNIIKAIEYGRVMKPIVKLNFESLFNVKIDPVGLCIDEDISFLAASPVYNSFLV